MWHDAVRKSHMKRESRNTPVVLSGYPKLAFITAPRPPNVVGKLWNGTERGLNWWSRRSSQWSLTKTVQEVESRWPWPVFSGPVYFSHRFGSPRVMWWSHSMLIRWLQLSRALTSVTPNYQRNVVSQVRLSSYHLTFFPFVKGYHNDFS